MNARWSRGLSLGLATLLLLACSGQPDVARGLEPPSGGAAGSGTSAGSGGTAGRGTTAGAGGTLIVGGSGGASGASAGSGGSGVDPCTNTECGEGQRCESAAGEAQCVDNSCDDIACEDSELCVSAQGGGHVCIDKCTSDAACAEEEFCDLTTGECVADECTPDSRVCGADDTIRVCSSNGEPGEPIACGSAGYFESTCAADAAGAGACSCEDDWDCPPFMTCEAGICLGTGVAPSCTLPATPFSDTLPEVEFRWGEGTTHQYAAEDDDDANDDAVGKAFPRWSQVVSTPVVINLDDDNGDGKADERDFPEILFITHDTDDRDTNGVLRAVHGGGPKKGQDFFALCGNPARPATPAPAYADENGAYWSEGAEVTIDCGTGTRPLTAALANGGSAPAAGDLDGDGFPEIVLPLETGGLQILSNRGEVLFTSPDELFVTAMANITPAPAIANLDFTGMPEIIVGNRVISLVKDAGGAFGIDKVYATDAGARGVQTQSGFLTYGPTVCVADLSADAGLEIVAGPTLYRLPASPAAGCGSVEEPCPLEVVWNSQSLLSMQQRDGFCAVADVFGACASEAECAEKPPGPANALDGKPEVILIANGNLVILDGASGALLLNRPLQGGDSGGAPNVDDFDGDGFPEIATALADFYQVIDLQAPEPTSCPAWDDELDKASPPPQTNPARNPGDMSCTADADCTVPGTTCNEIAKRCVCLHNGWKRLSEDDSSRVTSSSVFDFNGDGAAEVVYGDECYLRVYDGATGFVYVARPSVSRTALENPVIADVDNDGNAEIVFVQNNSFEQCDEGSASPQGWQNDTLIDGDGTVAKDQLPAGITVLGDPTDTWVAARRVWNQHGYHVTNVLESGAIPVHEPESWKPLNGRVYNTYRSQPRTYGVAPDLSITAIQISSPDAMCGVLSEQIEITVVVKNLGDLRVGPGVEVAFFGSWGGAEDALRDGGGAPLVVVLDKSLEPGASTLVTVSYAVGNNPAPYDGALPDSVRVTIDGGNMAAAGKERECREDNNELESDVDPGDALADLAVAVDSAACEGEVTITVSNNGTEDASDVLVRVYAGDPSAGGEVLGEITVPSVPAGGSVEVTVEVGVLLRTVVIWVIADPADVIEECNDANNVVQGPELVCSSEPH